MASDKEQKKDKSGKGFAGLSSMVSDVDAAVTSSEKARSEPSADATPAGSVRQAPQPQAARILEHSPETYRQYQQAADQPSNGSSSAGKWLLGIGALIGFVWLLSESGNKSAPPAPAYSPSTQPSVSAAPAPSGQPTVSAAPAPARQPPNAPARPQVPSRPSEETPPVGTNHVLGPAQIRYCLAEDIRLDAAKGALNNYVESDVDRFNAMIADRNSRCGHFRYRRGSLESARSEIEGIRSLLQSEGRSRFTKSPKVGSRQVPTEMAPSTPDATLLAVQRRLADLGYDAGVADGFAGPKTRAVIAAFEKDHGLQVTGNASVELLNRIRLAEKRVEPQASLQPALPRRTPSPPDLSRLTAMERQSIESACSGKRSLYGPVEYSECVGEKVQALDGSASRSDLSRLTALERQSIESACSGKKSLYGPAEYYDCVAEKVKALDRSGSRPNLSRLTALERQSIESACSGKRSLYGPAEYYECVTEKVKALERSGSLPDLSRLAALERQSIESACSGKRSLYGPAEYYECVTEKVQALERGGSRPDLSRLTALERQSIESACSAKRSLYGPAEYYECVRTQLSR